MDAIPEVSRASIPGDSIVDHVIMESGFPCEIDAIPEISRAGIPCDRVVDVRSVDTDTNAIPCTVIFGNRVIYRLPAPYSAIEVRGAGVLGGGVVGCIVEPDALRIPSAIVSADLAVVLKEEVNTCLRIPYAGVVGDRVVVCETGIDTLDILLTGVPRNRVVIRIIQKDAFVTAAAGVLDDCVVVRGLEVDSGVTATRRCSYAGVVTNRSVGCRNHINRQSRSMV
ncbi:MAG: hypothetical protein RBG13Loki_1698 [Promethearchaeota archaeon CR_4]|nr:MAG: hypothetical protein RBG13Loki_1698 [Candidatus Lokiarchaeota archaeon CR_4]